MMVQSIQQHLTTPKEQQTRPVGAAAHACLDLGYSNTFSVAGALNANFVTYKNVPRKKTFLHLRFLHVSFNMIQFKSRKRCVPQRERERERERESRIRQLPSK